MLDTAESSLPYVTGASRVHPLHPNSIGNVSSLGVADPDALSSSCMSALPNSGFSPTAPSIYGLPSILFAHLEMCMLEIGDRD